MWITISASGNKPAQEPPARGERPNMSQLLYEYVEGVEVSENRGTPKSSIYKIL